MYSYITARLCTALFYVNAQILDETALGRLMYDFHCTDADEMHYPVLAERVRYFKEDNKGVTTMSEIWDEVREEGKEEERETIAKSMLAIGDSCEKVAIITKLSLDTVLALAQELRSA